MKLALDVWYEAWGSSGNFDAVATAKHGEATGAPEAAPDRARGGCHGPEAAAGDIDPPTGSGP